jgi:hypothetical protein
MYHVEVAGIVTVNPELIAASSKVYALKFVASV